MRQAVFASAVEDIKAQLEALHPATFAAEVPYTRWQEYARYLKAVQLRLQRLPNNLLRDTQGTQDIQRRWKALQQKRTDRIARGLPLEPVEEQEVLKKILEPYTQKGVQYHALRTRQSGSRRFASMHVLVPDTWTVQKGHQLLESIEAEIRHALPSITVFTHLEPINDPASFEDTNLDRPEP